MITIQWKPNIYKAVKCMGCSISIPKEDCSFRFALGNTGIFHLCEDCAKQFIQHEVLEHCKYSMQVVIEKFINPQLEEEHGT
jgi:hypothetical protein